MNKKIFSKKDPHKKLVFLDEGKKIKLKEPKIIGDAFRALTGEVDLNGKPTGERPADELGILVHHESELTRTVRWEKERKDRKDREKGSPEKLKWKEKLEYGSLIVNMYPETIDFNGLDMLEESISEFYRAFNKSDPNKELEIPKQIEAETTLVENNSVDIVKLKRELTVRGWNVNVQVNKFKNPDIPADFFIDKSDFPLTRLRENTCFVEVGEFGVVMIKFYGSKRPQIKELLEQTFSEPAYYFMLRADGGMVYGDLRIDLDEQLRPLIVKLKSIGLKVTFVNTHWHFKRDKWIWWRYPEVNMDREIYKVPKDPLEPQTDEERAKEIENKAELDRRRGINTGTNSNNNDRGWI